MYCTYRLCGLYSFSGRFKAEQREVPDDSVEVLVAGPTHLELELYRMKFMVTC